MAASVEALSAGDEEPSLVIQQMEDTEQFGKEEGEHLLEATYSLKDTSTCTSQQH